VYNEDAKTECNISLYTVECGKWQTLSIQDGGHKIVTSQYFDFVEISMLADWATYSKYYRQNLWRNHRKFRE